MDFTLTQDHQSIRQLARDFAEREAAPRIKGMDERGEYDPRITKRMGELGLLGVCLPEKYGGAGMDYISLGLVCEELERVDTSLRAALSVHVALCSLGILQWGTREQKEKYLTRLATGEWIGAFGLTEPDAGSDAAAIKTTATRDGDHYVLNGEKTWISQSDVADVFLVFAITDRTAGLRGITAFLVERTMAGFSSRPIHGKLGVRAGNTGSFVLRNVGVPVANRLGEEGEGFKIAMSCVDNGRFAVAAGAVGLIQACLEASVRYANERCTFGQPIGQHQLVKRMIAHMAQRAEVGRLLYLRAGWLKNRGIRNTRETSLAKWYATEASFAAASDAVQLHGAYGYANDYPVERYLRNAKGACIYEGTSQIHELMQADYALGYKEDRPLRCELPPWPFPEDV